jgi:DNA-binding NarL/FixJ family response regulator
VLVADDHPATRASVRDALERGDCEVCAEASNAADAVRLALDQRPDACLLDIGMPGDGLWAEREIAKRLPDCRIIMLTVSDSSADLYDALQFGAVGYLLKGTSVDVPAAVHAALAGQTVLSDQLTPQVLEEFRPGRGRREVTDAEGHRVTFTPREIEVLALLTDGRSTAEIATQLSVRPPTVRRHISDIMHKLRVTSRAEALELLRPQKHDRQ